MTVLWIGPDAEASSFCIPMQRRANCFFEGRSCESRVLVFVPRSVFHEESMQHKIQATFDARVFSISGAGVRTRLRGLVALWRL